MELGTEHRWTYGGVRQASAMTLNDAFTFRNFWSMSAAGVWRLPALSTTLTRGGPLMATGHELDLTAALENSYGDTTRWRLEARGWWSELGSVGTSLSGRVSVQPSARLRFSLEPRVSLFTEGRQYVDIVAGGSPETYGSRYIFAAVDRREVSARIRADLFVSPELSIELYAEPFASSGAYTGFGELARARGRELRTYGDDGSTIRREQGVVEIDDNGILFQLEDPDFNLRSFRSNVVLRWEWRLGSTLFFVWQQDRSLEGASNAVLTPDSFVDTVGAAGAHILAIKLDYWFPVSSVLPSRGTAAARR